jgi:hypothetical protein
MVMVTKPVEVSMFALLFSLLSLMTPVREEVDLDLLPGSSGLAPWEVEEEEGASLLPTPGGACKP